MAYTLKRLLVGKAKKTAQAIHERLTKKTGLAVFASDALSSTAYASEEILLVLAVAYAFGQANGFNYIVSRFRAEAVAAHIEFQKGERSELAELAANIL